MNRLTPREPTRCRSIDSHADRGQPIKPLAASYLLTCLRSTLLAQQPDVIVVGATPSGVTASVAAARGGAKVVLVEESRHVGGIVAGGLTTNDIRKHGAVGVLFREFNRRVLDHYVTTGIARIIATLARAAAFGPHIPSPRMMPSRTSKPDCRNGSLTGSLSLSSSLIPTA